MSVNPVALGVLEFLAALFFVLYELRKVVEGDLNPKMKLPGGARASQRQARDASDDSSRGPSKRTWLAAIASAICIGAAIFAFRQAGPEQSSARLLGYAAIGLAAWIAFKWWRDSQRS